MNKQLEQESITFALKFNGKVYRFFLRMISVLEENQLRQRYAQLKDDEDGSQNFQINCDALNEFEVKPLQITSTEVGGEPLQIKASEFFAEQNGTTERVAEKAIQELLKSLVVDISFL